MKNHIFQCSAMLVCCFLHGTAAHQGYHSANQIVNDKLKKPHWLKNITITLQCKLVLTCLVIKYKFTIRLTLSRASNSILSNSSFITSGKNENTKRMNKICNRSILLRLAGNEIQKVIFYHRFSLTVEVKQ